MKNTQITTAETFGMISFENGKMRVAAQSKELMEMFTGRNIGQTPTGEASTTELIKSFYKGWDNAKKISREENK